MVIRVVAERLLECAQLVVGNLGARGHRDGDQAVELSDRGWRQADERVIEPDDPRPVGVLGPRGAGVLGGDRGLEEVRTGLMVTSGSSELSEALLNLGLVPERSVLIGKQHRLAGRVGSGGLTCIGEQDEREQRADLGFLRHQRGEQAREPDPLPAQIGPCQTRPFGRHVAFVEDQIDNSEHTCEPIGEHLGAGNLVWDPGIADLPFCSDQALREGRLR